MYPIQIRPGTVSINIISIPSYSENMIYKHKQMLGNFWVFCENRLQLKTNKWPITFDLLKINPPNFQGMFRIHIYIRTNR